jgi:hypothetical protein
MKELLVGLGAAFEFVGIILVGSPDFFPAAESVSGWLRARTLRALAPLTHWIGWPRARTVYAKTAVSGTVTPSASAGVSRLDRPGRAAWICCRLRSRLSHRDRGNRELLVDEAAKQIVA